MVLLYIDPGAGSMLIQVVLAGLLAIPFFFRSAVARAIARFRGNPRDRTNAEPDARGPAD